MAFSKLGKLWSFFAEFSSPHIAPMQLPPPPTFLLRRSPEVTEFRKAVLELGSFRVAGVAALRHSVRWE